jgi:hypothetical protein
MKVNKVLKYSFFIFIGGIIGFLSDNWHFFTFKLEIGIVELLNIIVTAFLGYYIANTIQKRQGASRIEKDLIISEIQKIRTDIDKIKGFIDRDIIPLSEVLPVFKNLSSCISETIDLSTLCKHTRTVDLEEIRTKVNGMKRTITNAPTSNDCFILDNSKKSQLAIKHKKIKELTFKSIVAVNRANI